MKRVFFCMAAAAIVTSCANSPEGTTNQEGSGSSVLPEKTGDTLGQKGSDQAQGGEYSTDTMRGTIEAKIKDSAHGLISQDSGTIKVINGTKPPRDTANKSNPANQKSRP